MRKQPIHIEKVFDDPDAIRAAVQRHSPYPAIASYLPRSATSAEQGTVAAGATLPWFRGTWAANGQPLVEAAREILGNRCFREAAARLFDTSEVTPNTVVVNVNAPMSAGVIHVDIPSFRGAARDRYPIQLLQAMGSSRLFESWRIIEAGAVVWFYEGPGGAYDYWPQGLSGPMRSKGPPFTNQALVADNDRMYHRIGWIGEPSPILPPITPSSQIEHVAGRGWVVADSGREVQSYSDEQVRISILWKGMVKSPRNARDKEEPPLSYGRIVEIFTNDLKVRRIHVPALASPLSGQAWLDLVHAAYYSPVERGE
jgi:hypothetical protein